MALVCERGTGIRDIRDEQVDVGELFVLICDHQFIRA